MRNELAALRAMQGHLQHGVPRTDLDGPASALEGIPAPMADQYRLAIARAAEVRRKFEEWLSVEIDLGQAEIYSEKGDWPRGLQRPTAKKKKKRGKGRKKKSGADDEDL